MLSNRLKSATYHNRKTDIEKRHLLEPDSLLFSLNQFKMNRNSKTSHYIADHKAATQHDSKAPDRIQFRGILGKRLTISATVIYDHYRPRYERAQQKIGRPIVFISSKLSHDVIDYRHQGSRGFPISKFSCEASVITVSEYSASSATLTFSPGSFS